MPREPEKPAPYQFPIVASIAPVVVSLAMWAVTQSAFALLFALLGPVVAIAGFADARLQRKRSARRERDRFEREQQLTAAEIDRKHALEREYLERAWPTGAQVASRWTVDPGRWDWSQGQGLEVNLGVGVVASGVEFDGDASAVPGLAARAARLRDAPVTADASLGLGFTGAHGPAAAAARSAIVQVARLLSPADCVVSALDPFDGLAWLERLPHRLERSKPDSGAQVVSFSRADTGERLAMVAVSPADAGLPGGIRTIVSLGAGSAVFTSGPNTHGSESFVPGFVSVEQAEGWSSAATAVAERDGLVPATSELADEVGLAELLNHSTGGSGLACAPLVGANGPIELDLVVHGPHAIVGGATGSGKSELLISWVLAMAAAHSPAAVNFLLIDFKGGSSFGGLSALPHSVGLLTDLDESTALRAMESLRAELKHRERAIAAAGARDITGTKLGRLVIVVDELAAMVADFPDLHALFTDIAARGRSLGMHLVLCTQRPAAVARDGVLANADLRLSLRVNNRPDSAAVVGTDDAAFLPPSAAGRAILSLAGKPPQVVQGALATSADAQLAAARWPGPWQPRRPWCAPLPPNVSPASLPAGCFALADLPEQQRQEPVRYTAGAPGHVLVLGAARSGKSTALAAIASAAGDSRWLPSDIEGAWDAVHELDTGLAVIDDLDSLLGRFGDEHRGEFLDRLASLLRDGPGAGLYLAIGSQRLTGELHALASLITQRLLLRQVDKQEHVLAGGDPREFRPDSGAGFGYWRGNPVQVAKAEPPAPAPRAPLPVLEGFRPVAVVSSRPLDAAARLGSAYAVVSLSGTQRDPRELVVSAGPLPPAVVGDPEEWQSRWGAIGALGQGADIVFDRCGIPEFRALARTRKLPPPIERGSDACLLLRADGDVARVRLPRASGQASTDSSST